MNIVVQIRKAYQGQPKQIAAALWGSSAAQYRYKHVTVVEEDIDPASYEQVDWAFAHRVNAGQDGIVVFREGRETADIFLMPNAPEVYFHIQWVQHHISLGTGA